MVAILPILAFTGVGVSQGSAVWYYTGENCTVIHDTDNPNHDEWSIKTGVNTGKCWNNEYEGYKDGARRRSIRIDKPAEGETNFDYCLWMYKDGDKTCSTQSVETMSFSQYVRAPVCYTFDKEIVDEENGYYNTAEGYLSYWITSGHCDSPTVKYGKTWDIPPQW